MCAYFFAVAAAVVHTAICFCIMLSLHFMALHLIRISQNDIECDEKDRVRLREGVETTCSLVSFERWDMCLVWFFFHNCCMFVCLFFSFSSSLMLSG